MAFARRAGETERASQEQVVQETGSTLLLLYHGGYAKNMNNTTPEIVVLLHNVRSAYNVGSIFRTADAAAVSRVLLTGYSPTPDDRFGRPRGDISKAALGAEKTVCWEHVKDVSSALKRLKRDGFCLVAVEQDRAARDYREYAALKPTCFVFGNEVRGLSSALLKKCDAIIDIPLHGKKESLNVAVAAGIVLFHAL